MQLFVRDWGPTGLLSLVVVLIIFGILVPLRTHRDVIKQRDAWQRTAAEALKQNTALLETTRTANATFKALKHVAEKEPEAHESAT